jgi:hypothetical protein
LIGNVSVDSIVLCLHEIFRPTDCRHAIVHAHYLGLR